MSISSQVRTAISEAIAAVSGVTQSLEGSRIEPGATQVFARLKVLQRESTLTSIGPNYRTQYAGLVQIDIIGPRSAGLDQLEEIAGAILNITREPAVDDGRLIVETVWQETVFEEPAKYRVPVFVRWNFYADAQ